MAIASVCLVNNLTSLSWAQGIHGEQFARIHPSVCARRTKRWQGGCPCAFSRRMCFTPASTAYLLWNLSDSAGPRFSRCVGWHMLSLPTLGSLYSAVYEMPGRKMTICSLYWSPWTIRCWHLPGCLWFCQWLPAKDLPPMVLFSLSSCCCCFIVYLVMSSLAS